MQHAFENQKSFKSQGGNKTMKAFLQRSISLWVVVSMTLTQAVPSGFATEGVDETGDGHHVAIVTEEELMQREESAQKQPAAEKETTAHEEFFSDGALGEATDETAATDQDQDQDQDKEETVVVQEKDVTVVSQEEEHFVAIMAGLNPTHDKVPEQDAREQSFWREIFDREISDILDLPKDDLKVLITNVELEKLRIVCDGPGCASAYEVTVKTGEGKNYSATVSYSWDKRWTVVVGDEKRSGDEGEYLIDEIILDEIIDDPIKQEQKDAREQSFWDEVFDREISDILSLSKEEYKVIVTQEELDEITTICMGPGCARGYDIMIATNDGQRHSGRVSYSWDGKWNVAVGDEHRRGDESERFIDVIELPKPLTMSPEKTALNTMARSLGVDWNKLNAWYEAGLIKIDVFRTFFGNFMNVSFDQSIPEMRINKSEVNPLGALAFPPASIFMAFEEDELETIRFGGPGSFGKHLPKIRITDMDIQYTKPQILGEIDGRDLSVQDISVEMDSDGDVKHVRLTDENGAVVKEVEYSGYKGCRADAAMCTKAMPSKGATIHYPESEGIVRRDVSFNVWQDENAERDDILLVNDFVHDADGKEVHAMTNEFVYERWELGAPCSVSADGSVSDCPKGGSYLSQIIRTQAGAEREDGSSTIQLFVNGELKNIDGRAAQVTLADGSVHAIEAFDTLEDLFEQVAAIEAKFGPESKLKAAAKKFDELLNAVQSGGVRLEEVLELRKLLGDMKDLLEIIRVNGAESIDKLIEQFENRFNQVDEVVTANLIIIKIDGKDIEVNVSEAARVLAEEYQRLSSSDTIDYSRLPGISKDDLKGHETFMDYLNARQVGRENMLPVFKNFSPYGHLTLIAQLMQKYGKAVIGGNVDQNDFSEVNFRIFRRMVNGTQQSYEQAVMALEKVLQEHAVTFPAEATLKVKDFATLAAAMDTLNGAIRTELQKVIEAYTGEEGFKRQLVQEINMKVQESYNPIVNAWNQIVQTRSVSFEIEGVGTVVMTAAELNDLTWDLPRDVATLLRYPGIQEGISKEILLSLDSSKAENARNYIDLSQTTVYGSEGSLSYYGTRIQLTEQFLKVYGSKIVVDGRVNRDNYREALLMNKELRLLLDMAVGMIDVAIEKAKTLGANAKDGISLKDYEAIMALIAQTNEASTAVLKLALDSVIYSVRNEITARLQERFNKLLNVTDALINGAKIKVAIDGTEYLLDPKEFHAAMKETLQRVAITYGNDYSREQYARLAGVSPEFLAGLRDASNVNQHRYINFNTYYGSSTGGTQQTPAQEEMWFRLVPSLIEKMGTSVLEDGKVSIAAFQKQLVSNVNVPVDAGKSILGVFTDLVNTLIGEALAKIEKADFSKWSEREGAEAVIHEVLKMLQDKANPLIQGLNDQEIGILNQLANSSYWNTNNASFQKLAQLVDQKRAAAPIVTVTMGDGKTIQMDMRAILNIPGFPSQVRFDRELFPGIQDSDLANTERMQNRYITLTKIPAAVDMAEGINLTALGREQLAVHILQRLYKSAEAGKIFTAEGKVNVEALRRFLKGVDVLHAQIKAQVEKWVKGAAEILEGLKTEPMTIEAIQAIYAHVTEVRAKILAHMNELTNRHEREDVLEMEEDVTATYQTLIDSMVEYVQNHDLVIKHDGKAVVLPVQDVTKRMLAVLAERFPDADLGAHHFASFFGVSVSDLRRYNKLEEFLGDQLIALPRNSQYIEVISKLSEIGMMELISDLAKRFAKEGVVKDGVVDVDRLMELVSDPKAAVEWARKKAVDMYTETREKLEALELPLTSKSFQELTDIVNRFKLDLVNDMNDHITSFTQEMFDEIQQTVTGLYGKIQFVRNDIITAKPIKIEARDGTVFELDLKALEPKALERILLLLETLPEEPIFREYRDFKPRRIAFDVALEVVSSKELDFDPVGLPKEEAPIDRIDNRFKPIKPIYRPIWYPFPTQFNPEDTLTQFGFYTLLVKLAEKFGSFATDEKGQFSAERFLKELGRTDEERAREKFDALQKEMTAHLQDLLPKSSEEAVTLDRVLQVHAFLDKAREQFLKTYQIFPKNNQSYYSDPIGNIANAAWSAVMGFYEKQLFSRDIIISTDRGDVTMNGKELVNILMEEYREGHTAFAESYVKDGETSWAYNDYKVLVNTWRWGYYERGLPYLEQYEGVALEDEKKAPSLYPFNLGDLNRLPGISEEDLSNLDVEGMNQVRLTISDAKVLLKGRLNMRVFAPGSGVQTIGASKSSAMMADSVASSVNLSRKIVSDAYWIGDWELISKNYLNNSNRDLAFRAIPAMIRDYADLFASSGKADVDTFRKLVRGELQEEIARNAGFLTQALESGDYDADKDGRVSEGDAEFAQQTMQLAIIFQKSLKDSVKDILDRNKDGELDEKDTALILENFKNVLEAVEEASRLAKALAGENIVKDDERGTREIRAERDLNGDGIVNVDDSELTKGELMEPVETISKEKREELLRRARSERNYDLNGDGYVDAKDLQLAQRTMELAIKFQKALDESTRNTLDRDQDGKLTKEDTKLILEALEAQFEKTRLRGLVTADLSKMTGLSKEELKDAILSIDVTYDKNKNATFTIQFKEGKMAASRSIDVLSEGKLPNTVEYRLDREIVGQTDAVPPSDIYGEAKIASADWVFKESDRSSLQADVTYENGRAAAIQWTRHTDVSNNGCGPDAEYCNTMVYQDVYAIELLYRDVYAYAKDSTITITRGSRLIRKPVPFERELEVIQMEDEREHEVGVALNGDGIVNNDDRQLAQELVIATPQLVMTLQKLADDKFYLTKLQEGFGTENGVITTDFIYLATVCRGFGCKPSVSLSSLSRHGEDGEMISSAQISDNTAEIEVPGAGESKSAKVTFDSLEHLLQQIRELEKIQEDPQMVKLRKLFTSDLVNTFGFDSELVTKLFKKGLLRVKADFDNLTAWLVISDSVELSADARNLANLLGSNKLPPKIQYQLGKIEPPMYGCDPSLERACPPQPGPDYFLMSASFRLPGEKDGQHLDFDLRYVEEGFLPSQDQAGDNRLDFVSVTKIDDPCGANPDCMAPATLTQVKEITYHWSSGQRSCQEGENCVLGFIDEGFSQDFADIKYFNDKNIVRRTVTFNSGGLVSLEAPAFAVLSVEEFILNADGKEELSAHSEFTYGHVRHYSMEMPLRGDPMAPRVLLSIVRTDAKGEVLSKIAMTQEDDRIKHPVVWEKGKGEVERIELPAPAWEGEGSRFAIVTLASGKEHSVRFDTLEQLLLKARQLEQDEVAAIARMRQSAITDLVQLTGLTEEALKKLVESVDIDWKQRTVSIQLKKGMMENGRQLDPMGKGNLPETVRYTFGEGSPRAIQQAFLQWPPQKGFQGRLVALINYDKEQRIQKITWQNEQGGDCKPGDLCIRPEPQVLHRDFYTHGKDIVIRREFDTSMIGHPESYPSDAVDFNEVITLRKMKDGRHYVVRHESRSEVSVFSYQDTKTQVTLTKIKRTTKNGVLLSDTKIAGYKATVRLRSGRERQMMIIGLNLGQLVEAIRQIERGPLAIPVTRVQDYFRIAALATAEKRTVAATVTTQREVVYQNTQVSTDGRLNLQSSGGTATTTSGGSGATSSAVSDYLQGLITGEKN